MTRERLCEIAYDMAKVKQYDPELYKKLTKYLDELWVEEASK